MANTHATLGSLFTDIADAIRTKEKSTDTIVADDFPTRISEITTGSGQAVTMVTDEEDDAYGVVMINQSATVSTSGDDVIMDVPEGEIEENDDGYTLILTESN